MNWNDMQLVLVLAREGSIAGAAQSLKVNASTIGRRLDTLEQNLGVHLFDRTRHGIHPTAIVERLIPHAELAEKAADDFVRLTENQETQIEGLVRITAPPGAASEFLGFRLIGLHQKYPNLQFQVDASIDYLDLSRREADIALRIQRPQSGDLITKKLGAWSIVIFASPEYASEVGQVDDLNALRWITWGPSLEHLNDAGWLSSQVRPEQIILRSDSIDTQVNAARSGLGAILLPESYAVADGLAKIELGPQLKSVFSRFPKSGLWMAAHRALRHVPRVAAVWDFILQEVGHFEAST